LLLKHQILILNRSRKRSPNLHVSDRALAGLMALLVRPTRLLRSAIVLKPSTLLGVHRALSKQKYRMLFSPDLRRQPGPKGPSAKLIRAVVEMKQRNPNWGCPRIAQQIALAFQIQIDKDVVRRILAHHHRPGQDSGGPSWLTFLGHMKDSLWSRIYSGASRPRCGPIGSWWSWINTRAGSLGSAFMRAPSMVWHSAGCSTAPFEGNTGCRSTLAPTTIRFTGSTSGKPICEYWR